MRSQIQIMTLILYFKKTHQVLYCLAGNRRRNERTEYCLFTSTRISSRVGTAEGALLGGLRADIWPQSRKRARCSLCLQRFPRQSTVNTEEAESPRAKTAGNLKDRHMAAVGEPWAQAGLSDSAESEKLIFFSPTFTHQEKAHVGSVGQRAACQGLEWWSPIGNRQVPAVKEIRWT